MLKITRATDPQLQIFPNFQRIGDKSISTKEMEVELQSMFTSFSFDTSVSSLAFYNTPDNIEAFGHTGEFNDYYVTDSPIVLALMINGKPSGVVSFQPSGDNKSLIIKQIQGFKKSQLGTILQMSQYFTNLVIKIAQEANYSKVIIQSAKNNPWIKPDFRGKEHAKEDNLSKLYDKPAIQMDFELDQDGNWVKDV